MRQSFQWMRIHPGEASKGQGLWQTWNVSFKSWEFLAMGTYTSCHRMARMYPSVCGKGKHVLLEKLWDLPLYWMKKSWCNWVIVCKLGRAGDFLSAHVKFVKAAWSSFFTSSNCNAIQTLWLVWLRARYMLCPTMLQQLKKNTLNYLNCVWLLTRAIWFGSRNLARSSPSVWWHVPKQSCWWKKCLSVVLRFAGWLRAFIFTLVVI